MQACMHAWKAFSCPSTMLWKATCWAASATVVAWSAVSSVVSLCWVDAVRLDRFSIVDVRQQFRRWHNIVGFVFKAGILMGRLTVSPRWTKALKQCWSGILSCRFHHCHRAIIWCIYQLYRFYDSKHCLVWCSQWQRNQKSNVSANQTSISTSTNHEKTPPCEHVRTRKVLQFLDSHRVLLPPSPFAVLSNPCLNLKWTHLLINRLRW